MDQAGRAIELLAIVWPISGFHSQQKLEQVVGLRGIQHNCPCTREYNLGQYSSRANDNWVVCWAGWIAFVGKGYTAIQPCSYLVPQLHGRTALNPSLVWLILGWRSYWGCTIRLFSDKSMPGGHHIVSPWLVAFVRVLGGGWSRERWLCSGVRLWV